MSPEEVAQVFGTDRFPPGSILYLSKNSILQDLVSSKRAFSNRRAQSKNKSNVMIDKVDVSCLTRKKTTRSPKGDKHPPSDLHEEQKNNAYATVEEPIVAPAIF